MYSTMTRVNSTVFYTWKLPRVNFKSSQQSKIVVTMWGDGCINKPFCGNHQVVDTHKVSTWYILNLHDVVLQWYLHKAGKKWKSLAPRWLHLGVCTWTLESANSSLSERLETAGPSTLETADGLWCLIVCQPRISHRYWKACVCLTPAH